ncbi:MAG: PrsW family intramembrane metalloprotease [Bacteroidia bacterium]
MFLIYFILFCLTLGFINYLIQKFKKDKKYKRKFYDFEDNTSIVSAVFLTIISFIIINFCMHDPSFNDLGQQVHYGHSTTQPWLESNAFKQMIENGNDNLDLQYQFITTHFDPNQEMCPDVKAFNKEQTFIFNLYSGWAKSPDPVKADKGQLCLGLYYFFNNDNTNCDSHLKEVKNDRLKYLNTYRARMYYYYGEHDKAYQSLAKEIRRCGDRKGAYHFLSELYDYEKRYDEIIPLAYDDYVKDFIPFDFKQRAYISGHDIYSYLKTLLRQAFYKTNLVGFAGALLILIIWIFYLRRVNVYQKGNWKSIVSTVILSAAFHIPVWLLYDFYSYQLHFSLNGGVVNDFLYCVFGIGFIEELIKILPFLVILRFTKLVNEPIDYIMYASLSALGFAFIENFRYFDDGSINIIHSRALTASVAHMVLTSIIAYGLVLAKYRYKKSSVLFFVIAFLIASFAHGFYDFWLLNPEVNSFHIVTFIFLLMGILAYASMINNALNHSLSSEDNLKLNTAKLAADLAAGLVAVFLFEYICMSFIYGPTIGNREFISSTLTGGYLILFLSVRLSNIDILPEEWFKIEVFVGFMPAQIIYGDKKPNYNSLIGSEFELKAFRQKGILANILPAKGKIIKREKISGNNGWFLVKLDHPLKITKGVTDHVLVRAKSKFELIDGRNRTIVSFVAIPSMDKLALTEKRLKDFIFVDWAVAG